MLAAALASGCHVVLEGPPGTGMSTLLRAVANAAGLGVELVEGNAELTPARLIGHHDPALVLSAGYTPDTFVDGPLLTAVPVAGDDAAAVRWCPVGELATVDLVDGLLEFLVEHGVVPGPG